LKSRKREGTTDQNKPKGAGSLARDHGSQTKCAKASGKMKAFKNPKGKTLQEKREEDRGKGERKNSQEKGYLNKKVY